MFIRPRYLALGAFLTFILATPLPSLAATAKPSCTISVTTAGGTDTDKKRLDALVVSGETVTVFWTSKNAQSAKDRSGDSVALQGSSTLVAGKDMRLAYTFKGSRSVTCTADLEVVSASIASVPAGEDGKSTTLSGRVSGAKSVRVDVAQNGTVLSSAKKVKAKRDRWSLKLKDDLRDGTYDVIVYGVEGDLKNRELARSTFSVGDVPATTLSASPISLLFGGTARAGGSVPVAYVKLSNTGKTAATITGFDLVQNGTAPVSSVIGFTTSDDKGGSVSTVMKGFQGKTAFVPLTAVINPGQFRIFTLKTLIAGNAGSYSGTQLKIDVSGVRSAGTVSGTFPMRGTTWTLSY